MMRIELRVDKVEKEMEMVKERLDSLETKFGEMNKKQTTQVHNNRVLEHDEDEVESGKKLKGKWRWLRGGWTD